MPNSINIPSPPTFAGDANARFQQLHSYLFRLVEQLTMILSGLENGTTQIAHTDSSNGDIYTVRTALRQLISDTAAELRREIEETAAAITTRTIGICRGTTACSAALPEGAYEDIAVQFDALPNIPVVVAGMIGSGSTATCQVLTGTITKSGFTLRISSAAGTSEIISAAWIAVA